MFALPKQAEPSAVTPTAARITVRSDNRAGWRFAYTVTLAPAMLSKWSRYLRMQTPLPLPFTRPAFVASASVDRRLRSRRPVLILHISWREKHSIPSSPQASFVFIDFQHMDAAVSDSGSPSFAARRDAGRRIRHYVVLRYKAPRQRGSCGGGGKLTSHLRPP